VFCRRRAATCVHEAGQFLSEVSSRYTKDGYTTFKDLKSSDITNIKITTSSTAGTGITDAKIDTTGVDYYCDGSVIANFKSVTSGTDYNLTVKTTAVASGDSPAAAAAKGKIKDNMLQGSLSKTFQL